ncbi:hypothetical protein ACFQZW_13020 [Lutibacter aestuarii]|uniref:Uncharacterized protein n=1 Tax=Lutibacter aestuarii TaxID=861111 RepID=A0ABW2Z856_9FLAO
MQVTNNASTIELNEQKLLNLIIDPKIAAIEKVVKKHYNVATITKLTPKAFNVLIYLAIVSISGSKRDIIGLLTDVYELTEDEIMTYAKEVFMRSQIDKKFNLKVYKLYIEYKQEMKLKNLKKSVA